MLSAPSFWRQIEMQESGYLLPTANSFTTATGKAEAVVSLGTEEIGVRSFSVDSDNAVWSATGKGLYRWKDGQLSVMDSRNGLPCSSIISMIKDNHGSFWLYAKCGLLKISASDWATLAEVPGGKMSVKTFDALDGAQPSYVTDQPLVSKSADGRLWFASSDKVQMIDPEPHLHQRDSAARVC